MDFLEKCKILDIKIKFAKKCFRPAQTLNLYLHLTFEKIFTMEIMSKVNSVNFNLLGLSK